VDPTPRPRPRLHFTPRSGWLNDPHGVVHVAGRYHLFFQHNPAATSWGAAIHWGHATSADLLSWTEQPAALTPVAGEEGCWSGSVLVPGGAAPVLFYTRVPVGGGPARAQVVRALGSPDLGTWRRDPAEPVIAAAPAGVAELRDPSVWRAADGWRMLLGARLDDGSGAAVQYRSADLRTWVYDGVVAQRPGEMWECPHLFLLDGVWVLLFSVLRDGAGQGVDYALGDYDGLRFTARTWGRFSHGATAYATTTFLDAGGRRCALSWLREAGAVTSAWAGALSLPWVLSVAGDRLLAVPHPHLESDAVTVHAPGRAVLGEVTVEAGPDAVTLSAAGEVLLRMPGGPAARVIVDAGLVVVVVAGVGGIGAARFGVRTGGKPGSHADS
jgi:beta-fructofuranosidase